ncbi:aminodeoxychorismate synthase component I [Gordonia sp. NPDC003424]
MIRTLIVDNYDSFTYNLVDLATQVNECAPVVVNHDVEYQAIDWSHFDNVIIAPGPGNPTNPSDFGIATEVIARAPVPILGVCLGHQGIGAAFGASVHRAPEPVHGRISPVFHNRADLFAGIPSPVSMVRYHSLIVDDLPDELEVLATTVDGLVMAIKHRHRPIWGVQFHPESIASDHGRTLMSNFRNLTKASEQPTASAVPATCARSCCARPTLRQRPNRRYALEVRRLSHEPDPSGTYARLFAGRRGAFWLDGTARREASEAITIMGDATGRLAEYLTYDVTSKTVRVESRAREDVVRVSSIFDYLKRRLRERHVPDDPSLPFDFHLGYVGYLGYELKAETGGRAAHRAQQPDAGLVFADRAVVIDHTRHATFLVALRSGDETQADVAALRNWMDTTSAQLLDVAEEPTSVASSPTPASARIRPRFRHSAASYHSLIEASQDLIRAGETYEVCLTNHVTLDEVSDQVALFGRVRALNPVPYAALLEFGELSVVSASPERFLRIRPDRSVESAPIKGTRPRGRTSSEDAALRNTLRNSEKERAENLMIVDLVRNDLARVCETGSVHVPDLFEVKSFATVHQLVSSVRGTLRCDVHPVDTIRALFPAGSMTGAPKVRTMAILDELEDGPRGIYSGALGYMSLSGAVDLSVVIRTMVCSGTQIEFGVGGAITALSDPDDEYDEIVVKAASSYQAIGGLPDVADAAPVSTPRG